MGCTAQTGTKDLLAPSQPSAAASGICREEHTFVKDSGNKAKADGAHAVDYAKETTTDRPSAHTHLSESVDQQREKINESRVQRVGDRTGNDHNGRGRMHLSCSDEFVEDSETFYSINTDTDKKHEDNSCDYKDRLSEPVEGIGAVGSTQNQHGDGVVVKCQHLTMARKDERGKSRSCQALSPHLLSGIGYPPDMKKYQIGCLTVKVYTGNILQLPVECIVVSDMPYLRSIGGAAKIVREAAGQSFADECDRMAQTLKGLKEGQCVMTSAGDLFNYKGVIHVNLPTKGFLKKRQQLETVEQSIVYCLEMANVKGIASVAIPCIGTGIKGFSIRDCAVKYFKAIDRFSKTATSVTVSEVHLVDIDKAKIKQVNHSATLFGETFKKKTF